MLKRFFRMTSVAVFLSSPLLLWGNGEANLLRNSEFRSDGEKNIPDWCVISSSLTIHKGDEFNTVQLTTQKARTHHVVMIQSVKMPPGKYTFSCELRFLEKWTEPLLVRIIKLGGENVYQTKRILPAQQLTDGSWTHAEMTLEIPDGTSEAVIGFDLRTTTASTVYIRKPILKKMVSSMMALELYPADFERGKCSILPGVPFSLEVGMKGNPDSLKNKQVAFELTLPSGVLLKDVYHWHAEEGKFPSLETSSVREGTYLIKLAPKHLANLKENEVSYVVPPLYSASNTIIMVLTAKPEAKPDTAEASLKTLIDDQVTATRKFQIKTLPPLSVGRLPTRSFILGVSGLGELTELSEKGIMYDKFLRSLARTRNVMLLTSDIYNTSKESIRKLQEKGYKISLVIGWGWGGIHLKYTLFPREKSEHLHIPGTHFMDTGLIVKDKFVWEELFGATLDFYIRKLGLKPDDLYSIVLNFEPGDPFVEPAASPANRAEFAQSENLPTIPKLSEIKTNYQEQWIKFRCAQATTGVKNFAAAAQRFNPSTKRFLCTVPMYLHPPYKVHPQCAVDPEETAEYIDGSSNMFYADSKNLFRTVKIEAVKLKKDDFLKLLMIDPAERSEMFYYRYTPEGIKQSVITAAAFAYDGVTFWAGFNLDGRYYQNIAEAYDAVAQVESIYRRPQINSRLEAKILNRKGLVEDKDGKVTAGNVESSEDMEVLLHQQGETYVITAFNFDKNKEMIVRAKIADFKGKPGITDIVSRTVFPDAEPGVGFLFSIPPEGVLVLKTGKIQINPLNSVRQAQMQSALKRSSTTANFINFEGHEKNLSYVVLHDKDKKVAIKAENSFAKIIIDPDKAEITSCVSGMNKDILDSPFSRGVIGEIAFHRNALQVPPLKYELNGFNCDQATVKLDFCATMGEFKLVDANSNPTAKLVFKRTIVLDGKHLVVSEKLENPAGSGKDIPISLRFKNILFPKEKIISLKGMKNLSDKSVMLRIQPEHDLPFKVATEDWKPVPITIQTQSGQKLTFRMNGDYQGLLIWRGNGITLEPIPAVKVLAPGKSVTYSYQFEVN